MRLFDRLCETFTRALGLSALAHWNDGPTSQHPLPEEMGLPINVEATESLLPVETISRPRFHNEQTGLPTNVEATESLLPVETISPSRSQTEDMNYFDPNLPTGPIFKPPNSSQNFTCDYSKMTGWKHTAGPGARTQWLEKTNSPDNPYGGVYDIWTDYEKFWPTGTTRQVCELSNERTF